MWGGGRKARESGTSRPGFSSERPSVVSADAEAVTESKAAAVVMQVLGDGFAQAGAYCTISDGTHQCAQDQLANRAGGRR